MKSVTARANANIAFIKYWGNADEAFRLPVNSSFSMILDGLYTETTVKWDESLAEDRLVLNGSPAPQAALQRVSAHLDAIRKQVGVSLCARVDSANNFPMGAGIASSAAAFAALTVAGVAAAGVELTEREMTTIARLGSGSASRSVPAGFVIWYAAPTHEESFAESIAAPDHWDLVDVIAIISSEHKAVGSRQGHTSANTSDLQAARVAGAKDRLEQCQRAVLERDFAALAEVVESDSNLMHAVMMTSKPPLFYWLPPTLFVMEQVRRWRAEGLNVCYTLDAGPNVHCICTKADAPIIEERLRGIKEVSDVRIAKAGQGATLIPDAI